MGLRNFLIEGVSGAGKTTVAEELERRGHHVIHGDRVLAYVGDPQSGEPLPGPPDDEADKVEWGYRHWIWPVDRVKELIADGSHAETFFCGGCRNSAHFIDLFDQVVVLEVDRDTLMQRLARRPEDEFGGRPEEQAVVLRMHATGEDMPLNATRIDAGGPVERVVDAIVARCRGA